MLKFLIFQHTPQSLPLEEQHEIITTVTEIETAIKEKTIKPLADVALPAIHQLPSEEAEKCKYILGILYEQVENVSLVIKKKGVEVVTTQTNVDDFNKKLKEVVVSVIALKPGIEAINNGSDLPLEVSIHLGLSMYLSWFSF